MIIKIISMIELIINYKDLQNQIIQALELIFKRIETGLKIFEEIDQQIKCQLYNSFKENISLLNILTYYSNSK